MNELSKVKMNLLFAARHERCEVFGIRGGLFIYSR